jgi:replicative DNA helicase
MGKCVAADTEVVLADGTVTTIEDVVRGARGPVVTLGSDARFGAAQPSAYVDDGLKPVFRVTTRSGRVVETTITHPFLTIDGWKRLGEIAVGDGIGVPRRLPVFGDAPMRECEVKLLAYLLGDGCLVDTCPEFTNTNERLRDEFREAAACFGGIAVREERVGGRAPTLCVRADARHVGDRRAAFAAELATAVSASGRTAREIAFEVGVSPGSMSHWTHARTVPDADTFARLSNAVGGLGDVTDARTNAPNALTRWLIGLGVWGHGARTKTVPAAVFRLPKSQLALFLNRLFATDGWATVLASGQPQVGFTSASERLVRQVAHLLLRFGVVGSIKRRSPKIGDREFSAWQIDVTDRASLRAFVAEIGIFGKEEAVSRVGEALEARASFAGRDVFPAALWARIDRARGSESWASLARRAGLSGNLHVGKQGIGRERLARIALAVGDAELRDLAGGDVLFDPIESIEPVGVRQVYDLTVPGTHNFVANDVCVHNTAFVLNLALNAALHGGVAVGIFSLEMSRNQLATRMLCSEARVDAGKVRTGHVSAHEDWPRLTEAAERLHGLPILIDDTPGLTIGALRSKARRLKAEYPNLGLVIIDYLQLMQGTGGAKESRENVISTISRGLKILAKELEVPVIALSQLNRSLESRTDKRPMPSDLRESGAIEQDADIILFIYRDEVYNEASPDKGIAEIIIAKQRSGPIGTVKLAFLGQYVLFQNLAGQGDPQGAYY